MDSAPSFLGSPRSRKPLSPLGTVGSNPTLSATTSLALLITSGAAAASLATPRGWDSNEGDVGEKLPHVGRHEGAGPLVGARAETARATSNTHPLRTKLACTGCREQLQGQPVQPKVGMVGFERGVLKGGPRNG